MIQYRLWYPAGLDDIVFSQEQLAPSPLGLLRDPDCDFRALLRAAAEIDVDVPHDTDVVISVRHHGMPKLVSFIYLTATGVEFHWSEAWVLSGIVEQDVHRMRKILEFAAEIFGFFGNGNVRAWRWGDPNCSTGPIELTSTEHSARALVPLIVVAHESSESDLEDVAEQFLKQIEVPRRKDSTDGTVP